VSACHWPGSSFRSNAVTGRVARQVIVVGLPANGRHDGNAITPTMRPIRRPHKQPRPRSGALDRPSVCAGGKGSNRGDGMRPARLAPDHVTFMPWLVSAGADRPRTAVDPAIQS